MPSRATIAGLDATVAKLKDDVAKPINLIGGEARGVARDLSPVDTGNFRGNWRTSIGSVGTGVNGTRANPAPPPPAELQRPWAFGSGNIYVYNATDYADALDAGHSQQAPQGVTDPTTAVIDARFRVIR